MKRRSLRPVLHDLQFIQANYQRWMIKCAVAHLFPPIRRPWKTHRKMIIDMILEQKMTLGACCHALGLPMKNKSVVAQQVHEFCRSKNLAVYEKGIQWHDTMYCKRAWYTPVKIEYLQLHAEKFLKK